MTIELKASAVSPMSAAPSLSAQARVEENIFYGMYSGPALLMDVRLRD